MFFSLQVVTWQQFKSQKVLLQGQDTVTLTWWFKHLSQSYFGALEKWQDVTGNPFYVEFIYFQGILLVLLVIGKLVKTHLSLSSKSAMIWDPSWTFMRSSLISMQAPDWKPSFELRIQTQVNHWSLKDKTETEPFWPEWPARCELYFYEIYYFLLKSCLFILRIQNFKLFILLRVWFLSLTISFFWIKRRKYLPLLLSVAGEEDWKRRLACFVKPFWQTLN